MEAYIGDFALTSPFPSRTNQGGGVEERKIDCDTTVSGIVVPVAVAAGADCNGPAACSFDSA